MNSLQLQILLALPQLEQDDASVTHLALLLRSSKSAVSRACDELENGGLLKRKARVLLPTKRGRQKAAALAQARDGLLQLLENGGVEPETAAADSLAVLQHCSEKTAALAGGLARRIHFIRRLQKEPGLTLRDFFAEHEEGTYPLPFALYKATGREGHALSMANDAFYHPGQFCVGPGGATIRLRTRPVAHTSAFHQLMMQAGLKNMRYQSNGQFCGCMAEGDTVVFPAECLTLCCIPQADLLLGDVLLQVEPDVEEKHMPQKTVLFTGYF